MIKRLVENPMVRSEPAWNWTGADVLNFKNDDARLHELVAMFPSKRFSDEEIAAYLADLRARFQRWLHQDEFGPARVQRAATLRALMKSIQRLEKHLMGISSLTKGRLDAELRNQNNPSNLVMQALYEADRGNRKVGQLLQQLLAHHKRWRHLDEMLTDPADGLACPQEFNLFRSVVSQRSRLGGR
jgi:hypothetical protein